MKISIVLGAFFPVPPIRGGAVEKAWFALGQEFARHGHDITFVSRAMPEFPDEETVDGIKHLRVRGFEAPRSFIWLKILDLIYSLRVKRRLPRPADVIVTNTFWLPILLRNSQSGKIYAHVARFPKGQMGLYANAARLQAPSSAVARAIEREAPKLKDKVRVIPYPSPRSAGEPIPSLQRPKVLLFVGRIHPEKGVHLLVQAFADLSREVASEWSLSIVGPAEANLGGGGRDYLVQLERIAARATGKVAFPGPVFDADTLEQHFLSAQLFVYPSLADRGESFGLAPLEAMAHGCAVIVSGLECFADFIRDGETGFVFDHHAPNPAATLRLQIERAILDPKLLSRVAEKGRLKSADYSLDRVAGQFLHDFSSIIAEPDVRNR